MDASVTTKEPFFCREGNFYRTFFRMLAVVALQNLVAYSVNMLDNIMLGAYDQYALSGAATVNQIFFVINQFALSIGGGLVAVCSQYRGKRETGSIRLLSGIALTISGLAAVLVWGLCAAFPEPLLRLFTTSPEVIAQGKLYLDILKWTFVLFLISNLLISMLRSVETVKISFVISVVSLLTNGCVNYALIYGHFGFPELGIRGAAIGTLIARSLELLIVAVYILAADKKVALFRGNLLRDLFAPENRKLWHDFWTVAAPAACSGVLWSFSVPMQTAILGHLSTDAIAANSVATTLYQYLKVIIGAMASTSAVLIGKHIGEGDLLRVRAEGRTLSAIFVLTGVVLGAMLLALRAPLLSLYRLTEAAAALADHIIVLMAFVMVGMSYQMPVSSGVIFGGGDIKFNLYLNLISTWGIVMPLSFLAAFVWKLPVELVVLVIQSDQFFKGIPVFLRFRSYKWIHRLTN